MTFWIALVVMTILAVAAVAVPLFRARSQVEPEAEHDVAVYKDQLRELNADVERGTLNAEEAEAARTEVARRLLRASRETEPTGKGFGRAPRLVAIAVAAVGIPALSVGLYLTLGSPGTPDQPLFARLHEQRGPQTAEDIASLVRRMESYLKENPEDARAWAIIGPVYLRFGLGDKAVTAFRNAIRLGEPTSDLEASLGEAYVSQADGQVTDEAKAAFERALTLDPENVRPRFFLAVALNQEGRHAEAVKAWEALLKGADPSLPWVPFAKRQLDGARIAAGMPALAKTPAAANETPAAGKQASATGDEPAAALPGPSQEDVAAARQLSSSDRQTMIQNMVQGLADRLDSEGGSVDEWLRLLNAYGVLGEKDAAVAAAQKARKAYKDDSAALQRIAAAAKRLGLPE